MDIDEFLNVQREVFDASDLTEEDIDNILESLDKRKEKENEPR